MEWHDEAIVLSAGRHGESGVVVRLLTRAHGRWAGMVPGGGGRRAAGVHEPGNQVAARWRARLDEHLGRFTCELRSATAARHFDDPPRLAALASACALVDAALPEREPHPEIHDALLELFEALEGPGWAAAYARWEVDLLAALGFGLDLGACAATGVNDGLAYVSPRTGRAVSLSAGAPYRDRLLPLPPFLISTDAAAGPEEIGDALRLTGYFLEHHVFAAIERAVPAARGRLVQRLSPMPSVDG